MASSLALMPDRLVGIPLYICVETILGIAILNKASGLYGLLSILTGHPLSFWQWLFNVLALMTIPCYVLALTNISRHPQVTRKVALASIVYVTDSCVGFVYTLIFANAWVTGDSQLAPPAARKLVSAQLASPAREVAVTTATVIGLLLLRVYTTMVVLQFCVQLLRKQRQEQTHDQALAPEASSFARTIFAFELRARDACARWML